METLMQVLNEADARHLLVRTGFTPSHAEPQPFVGMALEAAVDRILQASRQNKTSQPYPVFVNASTFTPAAQLKTQEERQAQRRTQLTEGYELKRWWVWEMLTTQNPLAERMTLFWHNHFATSQQKVVRSLAMWNQHQLLRKEALGNFKQLLHGIVRDSAMLVYLDNANSRKEAPNENLARELFELFTLGESSTSKAYSEADIKEAARALTGYSIEPVTGAFVFRPRIHDIGSKTIFGRTGNIDGDQLIDLILDQPRSAQHIASKLWLEFVSPTPNPAMVAKAAEGFRRSGYDIAVLLKSLLTTDEFWAASNRASLIKSPIELLVGVARQFQFAISQPDVLINRAGLLGQNLLMPPNVKGWPGGKQWINATTLLERKRTTEQIFSIGNNMNASSLGMSFDRERFLNQYGATTEREPDAVAKPKLAGAMLATAQVTTDVPAGTVGSAYLRALTLDPAFQLK
jgi:uncharacterized protein (DUF1800 family)